MCLTDQGNAEDRRGLQGRRWRCRKRWAPLFGFGNTEEEYRTLILGCKEQGRKHQGPLNHNTGRGWVKQQDGQYKDALVRTRASSSHTSRVGRRHTASWAVSARAYTS